MKWRGGGLWVDLGCGNGEVLTAASKNGWDAIGFDADPNEINFAKTRGLDARQLYIDMLNLNREALQVLQKAKVVSLFNIIEHVKKPHIWIESLSEIMGTGSFLVIDTPREPSLTRLANFAALKYNYKHLIPPEHISIFTENSLRNLMSNCGFDLCAKWCFGTGFLDLIYAVLLLSDNSRFHADNYNMACFDDIFENANRIQKTIDECGLSNNMLCIFKKC